MKKETRGTSQPPLVRRQRHALFRSPLAHRADGLRPHRLRGQAGHRDHQHLVGHQPLPHALQAARRGSEARRLAGRRLPARDAGDGAGRDDAEAHHHDVPQLPRDGDRGTAALLSGRRRGAHGRLRQDHARAHHGRDQHEPAGDLPAGGPDAELPLARPDPGLGIGHLEVLGRAARRAHHAGRLERNRGHHRALAGHLHDHGHRGDDDVVGRSARLHAAGLFVDSRAGLEPRAHGHADRKAHRRDGVGGPQAARLPVQRLVRQRDHHADGDGRLDQRDRAPGGDGGARGPALPARALQRDLGEDAR